MGNPKFDKVLSGEGKNGEFQKLDKFVILQNEQIIIFILLYNYFYF